MPSFLPVEVFKGGLLLCLGCCNPGSLVGVSASLLFPPRVWEFAALCLLTDLTLGGPCKPPVVTAKARVAVWKGTPDEEFVPQLGSRPGAWLGRKAAEGGTGWNAPGLLWESGFSLLPS